MAKRVLILGITGQDGSYLAELLLEKGYEVHGLQRRTSTDNTTNIKHIINRLTLHQGDMLDPLSIHRIIADVRPDEIYNEADQDNIRWSHNLIDYNCDITAAAVGRTLEMILRINKDIRYFQPISATIFNTKTYPQSEDTPLNPLSPYACAKAAALYLVRYYRQVHGLFAATAIYYNHDSPRRTEQYLLPKICKSAARMARGEQEWMLLGNTSQLVDIGFAGEYVEAAWQIMQLNTPDDFVISSGKWRTIRRLAEHALHQVGIITNGKIKSDPEFYQPKPPPFVGDATKARSIFGFSPKYTAEDVIDSILSNLKEL